MSSVSKLIIFNYHQTAEERKDTCDVENSVDVSALLFLLLGMCRLEHEDCLHCEKDACRIEELSLVIWTFDIRHSTTHWMSRK